MYTSILPGIYCENVWLSDMFVFQVFFFSMKNGVNMNALLWRTTKIQRYYKPVPGKNVGL